jgi:uncharacterized membrane protein (DUF373 family)
MALAFDETERTRMAPGSLRETAVHVLTYRKFTVFATIGACAVPIVLAFVLYWTT